MHIKDSGHARRLLALADIYDGSSRSEAAQDGGVRLQSVHDWVFRFNSHGPEELIDIKLVRSLATATPPADQASH